MASYFVFVPCPPVLVLWLLSDNTIKSSLTFLQFLLPAPIGAKLAYMNEGHVLICVVGCPQAVII